MSISKLSQLESYLCDATFSLHVNRVLAEAAPVYRALGERDKLSTSSIYKILRSIGLIVKRDF